MDTFYSCLIQFFWFEFPNNLLHRVFIQQPVNVLILVWASWHDGFGHSCVFIHCIWFSCSYGQGICWSCGTFFRRGFVAAHRLGALCLGVFPSQARAYWHKAFFSTSLYIFLNCVGKILELFSWWMLEKVIRDVRNMEFRISSEEFYSNAILNSVSLIWTVLAKTCILEMCKICWFFPFLSLMGCNCSGVESALPGCQTSNSNEDLAARLSSASYQVRELFKKASNNIFLNM